MSLDVSKKALERLSCYKCQNLLSDPLIVIAENPKEYRCDRCDRKDDSNIIYEELSKNFLFPCKFCTFGCESLKSLHQMQSDEKSCAFVLLKCPFRNCTHSIKTDCVLYHILNSHANKEMKRIRTNTFSFSIDDEGVDCRYFTPIPNDDTSVYVLKFHRRKRDCWFYLCCISCTTERQIVLKTGNVFIETIEAPMTTRSEHSVHFTSDYNLGTIDFEILLIRKPPPKIVTFKPLLTFPNKDFLMCTMCKRLLNTKPRTVSKASFECEQCGFKDIIRMSGSENLTELFLHPCQKGCNDLLALNSIEAHQNVCKFPCPNQGCCHEIGAKSIRAHYTWKHRKLMARKGRFDLGNLGTRNLLVLVDKEPLLVEIKVSTRGFSVGLFHFKNQLKEFQCDVKVKCSVSNLSVNDRLGAKQYGSKKSATHKVIFNFNQLSALLKTNNYYIEICRTVKNNEEEGEAITNEINLYIDDHKPP